MNVGDVVQLDPESHEPWIAGQLMTVTEVKGWGLQGYVSVTPTKKSEHPTHAYYRAENGTFEYVGASTWVLGGQQDD